jgi:predicted RNase H-like HicB family nuclease
MIDPMPALWDSANPLDYYWDGIDLEYSLIIEATKEPDYLGFYSPDLPGFSGIGHSVEDCLYKAKWGMLEHVSLLKEQGLPVPPKNGNPKIIIQE